MFFFPKSLNTYALDNLICRTIIGASHTIRRRSSVTFIISSRKIGLIDVFFSLADVDRVFFFPYDVPTNLRDRIRIITYIYIYRRNFVFER